MATYKAKCPCCDKLNWHYIHPHNKEYDKWDSCEHYQSMQDNCFVFNGVKVPVESPDTKQEESVDKTYKTI